MKTTSRTLAAMSGITFLSLLLTFSLLGGSADAATKSPAPKPVASKAPVKAPVKATSAAKPVVTKAPAMPSRAANGAANGRGGFANQFTSLTTAQRACLTKKGITLPSPRPSGAARPTGAPAAGANGGGFGGARMSLDPVKLTAAYKACKIALPAGGFPSPGAGRGGAGNFDPTKLAAFQKCMTDAGIASTGGMGGFDQSDPDTAVALIKCQKQTGFTLPTRGGGNAPGQG